MQPTKENLTNPHYLSLMVLTIAPDGTDLVDGVNASISATGDESHRALVSNGVTQWLVVSSHGT